MYQLTDMNRICPKNKAIAYLINSREIQLNIIELAEISSEEVNLNLILPEAIVQNLHLRYGN